MEGAKTNNSIKQLYTDYKIGAKTSLFRWIPTRITHETHAINILIDRAVGMPKNPEINIKGQQAIPGVAIGCPHMWINILFRYKLHKRRVMSNNYPFTIEWLG